VMPWPVAADVPTIVTILVFSAAALWFVGLANLAPESGGPAVHREHRVTLGYHAVMMAAMAWMAVAMSNAHTAAGTDVDGGQAASPLPGWAGTVTLGFAVVLACAAVWLVVRLARPSADGTDGADAGLPPVLNHLLDLGMAVGMGGALLVLT
jgi:hypothetical protein